jgi:phosphoglycolate phosphatase-like HAD superfamily hydrolase
VRKLFLFDVDGTLILTGGAGIRALALAFGELYGVEKGTEGVDVAGRIDTAIFRASLAKHGLPDDDFGAQVARFRDAYCGHLEHTLPEATGGRVLPGVRELLTALHGRDDVRLALATGNFRRGAELKLSYYGLWQFFDDGAFAEDSENRADLVAIARRRHLDEGQAGESVVYVVGDTAHDVEAARANGAVAVAVASGFSGVEQLRASAPDFLFPDFTDWRGVLAALGIDA